MRWEGGGEPSLDLKGLKGLEELTEASTCPEAILASAGLPFPQPVLKAWVQRTMRIHPSIRSNSVALPLSILSWFGWQACLAGSFLSALL